MEPERQVYVISDLHLGGAPKAGTERTDFRIFTETEKLASFIRKLTEKKASKPSIELVINGDFVDFLAEPDPDDPKAEKWAALKEDPKKAVRVLEKIIGDEQRIFDALAEFLASGHRLALLLGNHDIELSFPAVRRKLEEQLRARERDFHFLYDGEAYVIGEEVLIEHGNRYDNWNRIDLDALRRVRSRQSRRETVTPQDGFTACPGSDLVARVINEIKKDCAFVNLLKPENDVLVPILLAIAPSRRKRLTDIARLGFEWVDRWARKMVGPRPSPYVSSTGAKREGGRGLASTVRDELEQCLRDVCEGGFKEYLDALRVSDGWNPDVGKDIARGSDDLVRASDLWQLLSSDRDVDLKRRLPALLRALKRFEQDCTFDRAVEPLKPYLEEVDKLVKAGFKLIIFGHTHLERGIKRNGGHYLNTGTWANTMRFPSAILSEQTQQPLEKLEAYIRELMAGKIDLHFLPTYAKLDLGEKDKLITFRLGIFDSQAEL